MQGKIKTQSKEAEVRRKLAQSGISKPEEFEEIISNLISQRERLEGDLQALREKVVALQQKQARKETRPQRNHPKSSNAVLNQREELSRKYEELKQWQKRSSKAMKTTATNSQYRAYLDKIFNIEQEIQEELKKYNDEKNTYTKLKKALKVIDKEDQKNTNVQEGIQRENQLLKKRIGSMKKIVDRQMAKEIQLQTCLIDMREKEREGQEKQLLLRMEEHRIRQDSRRRSRLRDSAIRNKTEGVKPVTVSDVSSEDLEVEEEVSLDFIPGQMTTKDQIFQMEGYLNRLENRYLQKVESIERRVKQNYPYQRLSQLRSGSKLTFAKEFDLTLQHCKSNLEILHSSNKSKIDLLLQKLDNNLLKNPSAKDIGYTSTSLTKGMQEDVNYYSKSRSARKLKSIVGEVKVEKDEKEKEKENEIMEDKVLYPRTFEETAMQTDVSVYNDPNPLRTEFVGILSESRVDDRHLLGSQKNSSIKTLHVYYTDRGIASIRAVYTLNPSSETLQGKSFLPDPFLQNYCKVHTISTSAQDFIRYFKLRYNFLQTRITSLKIVTNRNMKNGWGDHKIKNEEKELDEEIQKDYVFDINKDQFPVSVVVSHIQKGPYWYLCGFGVEINQL